MRLKLKNFLNTIESFIRTDATVARVYQFPDRDITIAGTDDVATVQSDATQAISDAAAAQLTAASKQSKRDFNVVDYGAVADGTTDCTSAIQSAINAAVTEGGGTVYFPYSTSTYIVSGALQTSVSSVNPNCQLYIPNVPAATAMVYVKFKGGSPTNLSTETFGGILRNTQGVILESTILGSGTLPAVIGTPWQTYSGIGDRNYVYLHLEDIVIRTRTKTSGTNIAGSMSAVNASKFLGVITDGQVKFDITSDLANSVQPTNETYGLILPAVNNKALLRFNGIVFVEGYKYGIVIQEHLVADYIIAVGCVNGIAIDRGFHSVHIMSYLAEACITNIAAVGECNVLIDQFDVEHQTSGWYVTLYDVFFTIPASTIISTLNFARTRGIHIKHFNNATPSVGVFPEFLCNNTSEVYIDKVSGMDLQKTVQVLSSTSWDLLNGWNAVYSATANTAITISNKFENSEYVLYFVQDATGSRTLSIDGFDLTLPSAGANGISKITIGYKNATYYFSTVGVANSTLTTLLSDTFTRADSASSISSLETPATAWTVQSGTWGIRSNQGYCVTTATGSQLYHQITIDAGVGKTDGTLSVDMKRGSGNTSMMLITRWQDANNFIAVEISGSGATSHSFTLYKRVAGTFTIIGAANTSVTLSVGATMNMKIVTSGNSITTYRDGILIHNATDAAFNTSTVQGLLRSTGPADAGTSNFDNFLMATTSFTAPPGGSGDALTTNPLSQFAATTSSQLSGVISDETGTGALVFATSPTFAGKPILAATTTGGASIIIPHGTAPTSPADGDMWTTTAGLFIRINNVTVGPLGSAGSPTAFTSLLDVPASYSGQSLKTVRVNSGETALEFTTAGSGDLVGPASAVDSSPVVFDGATGKLVKNIGSAWSSWTPTPTGFSGSPTVSGSHYRIGNTGFIRTFVNGTSNTSAFTITNFPLTPKNDCYYLAEVTNGGTGAVGRVYFTAGSTTVTIHPSMTSGSWTGSGAKSAIFTVMFEIQ